MQNNVIYSYLFHISKGKKSSWSVLIHYSINILVLSKGSIYIHSVHDNNSPSHTSRCSRYPPVCTDCADSPRCGKYQPVTQWNSGELWVRKISSVPQYPLSPLGHFYLHYLIAFGETEHVKMNWAKEPGRSVVSHSIHSPPLQPFL